MSNATNMIEILKKEIDIHTKTASDIFDIPIDIINSNMRRQTKVVNFGILYEISSFGLSEDLNIDVISTKNFIDNYLQTFPNIKEFMDEIVENAQRDGCVKTIMNRKRKIDEFNNKKLKSKMLIQVHDELVFNVVKEEEAEVEKIISDIMENAYKLNVPLNVDINKGNNWYEVK